MTKMTAFESLIAGFSEKMGTEISPASDGSVSIEADGVYITVQSREAQGDALLFSFPVGDMKPEPAMKEKALELAAHGLGTDGFYLGISGGVLVLSGAMPLSGASAEDLANKLLALASATSKVGSALARAIAEYAESKVESEKNPQSNGNFSMIHV